MERWVAKVITNILVFIVLFFFTALPIKVAPFFQRKGEKGKKFLSLIECFGGGILLSTYLLQMIPEIRHILERTLLEPYKIHYPIPELITAAGFFFLIFLEKLVLTMNEANKKVVEYDIELAEKSLPSNTPMLNGAANGYVGKETKPPAPTANGHAGSDLNPLDVNNLKSTPVVGYMNGHAVNGYAPPPSNASPTDVAAPVTLDNKPNINADVDVEASAVRSIILLLALSLDCLFEGLSLGLMRTTPACWNMFIAIATHESVVVFNMGLELVKVHPPKRVLFISFMFALMCPIGGIVGACILEIKGASVEVDMATGVLQAMTAGMFIYVTFFQILEGEISGHSPMYKLLALVFGFACMAALVAVPGASPTPFEDESGHFLDPFAAGENITVIDPVTGAHLIDAE